MVGTGLVCCSAAGALRTPVAPSCESDPQCFDRCAEGEPGSCQRLGDAYVAEEELDEAIDAYERGCQLGDSGACASQINLLRQRGREGEAEAILLAACAVESAEGRCIGLVHRLDIEGSDPQLARLLGQRCAGGEPTSCRALGELRRRGHQPESARAPLERACDAGDLQGCLALAEVLTSLGRPGEAEAARGRARDLGAEP